MKSIDHEQLGDALAAAGRSAGIHLVLAEHERVDRLMVAIQPAGFCLIAGEIEMTERNAVPNCLRDFRQVKCDAIVTVCPDQRILNRVVAKLAKHLPVSLYSRVAVFTRAQLEKGAVTQWISSVAGRDACLNHRCKSAVDSEVCDDGS